MVGEFPELQGLMGRYYALKGGTKPEIARAIELHYKPKGPTDTVPLEEEGDQVAIAVALADKLDTLVGFWAIDEKPTGSGDPYQLRRAALGVIRIVLENDLRLSLSARRSRYRMRSKHRMQRSGHATDRAMPDQLQATDLLAFFADRLKVHLREEGERHDLIDAVFALPGQDDLALIVKRVEALSDFLETDDGANLLAGVKRAANILAIEEKKDKKTYDGDARRPAPEGACRTRAGSCNRQGQVRHPGCDQRREFRRRHARAGRTARPRRQVLRRRQGQRRRHGRARKPPETPLRNPRRHPDGRRLLQNCGLIVQQVGNPRPSSELPFPR